MPSCIFPHCNNRQSLYRLPKLHPPSQASIGSKRKTRNKEIDVRNETHRRTVNVLQKYIPNYVYDSSNDTHRICLHYYHPHVQHIDKIGKIGLLLGAMPTQNSQKDFVPKDNAQHCVITNHERKNILSNPNVNKPCHEPLQLVSEREARFFNREKIIKIEKL